MFLTIYSKLTKSNTNSFHTFFKSQFMEVSLLCLIVSQKILQIFSLVANSSPLSNIEGDAAKVQLIFTVNQRL